MNPSIDECNAPTKKLFESDSPIAAPYTLGPRWVRDRDQPAPLVDGQRHVAWDAQAPVLNLSVDSCLGWRYGAVRAVGRSNRSVHSERWSPRQPQTTYLAVETVGVDVNHDARRAGASAGASAAAGGHRAEAVGPLVS